MTPLVRPALRWHGGKWLLAPWIIGHFPPHDVYVEPFGGGASVLLRKRRTHAEVYNDLDDEVVNLFAVLRSPDAGQLVEMLRLTPFARPEFEAAYEYCTDPLERARRLVIRSFMGFGSGAATGNSSGFRANSNRSGSNRSGSTPAQDWTNYPDALAAIVDRVRGLIVEHRPAVDVMKQHDSKKTLHYVDPPYLHETRSKGRNRSKPQHTYRHEMSEDDHRHLLSELNNLTGMVVLSGYPSPLYDQALADWERVECSALADGARARVEVLWLNPAAAAAMPAPQLFSALQRPDADRVPA